MLAWDYPVIGLFTGWMYPGGAPPRPHFLSHVAKTWLPCLISFFVAYFATKGQARFLGAVISYIIFLIWSAAMLFLAEQGFNLSVVFNIGMCGALIGGAFLYLLLVDPQRFPK